MICIRPIAPLGDRAVLSPVLSTAMTARIQRSGMAKRVAASAMCAAHGSRD
jgi:hypothetical protein